MQACAHTHTHQNDGQTHRQAERDVTAHINVSPNEILHDLPTELPHLYAGLHTEEERFGQYYEEQINNNSLLYTADTHQSVLDEARGLRGRLKTLVLAEI